MAVEELDEIHFVMHPGRNELNLHMIKIWALANPTKRIVIWYDSFADLTKQYFDMISDEWQKDLSANPREKLERFRMFLYKKAKTYLTYFGGNPLMRTIISQYIEKLKELTANGFSETVRDHLDYMDRLLSKDYLDKDIKGEFSRDKEITDTYKNGEALDRFIGKLPKEIRENVTSVDFNGNALKGMQPGIYSLYCFELLCDQDTSLTRNLLMCMIASGTENGIVIPANSYPALNDRLLEYWNDGALDFAISTLQDTRYMVDKPNQELADLIKSMDKSELFVPIERVDPEKMYAFVDETEGTINYLKFSNDHQAVSILQKIYEKRSKQIELFSLWPVRNCIRNTLPIDELDESERNGLFSLLDECCNRIVEQHGSNNAEIVRQMATSTSLYKNHISECTGTLLWREVGVEPLRLPSVDMRAVLPSINRTPAYGYVNRLHRDRMDSKFDLDIFVYIHEGAKYLGHTRYPHYSKKGILFVYDGQNTNFEIQFGESGIVLPSNEILTEAGVRSYIRNVSDSGKRIRIQVLGHSASNYEQTGIPFVREKVDQTVGGLYVKEFSELFSTWFNKYLDTSIGVDRLVFIACELADFKNKFGSRLKELPSGTFLEQFINDFRSKRIRIREINASDRSISIDSLHGRMQRIKKKPGVVNKLFKAEEIRKLIINSDEVSKSGKYKCTPIKYEMDITAERTLEQRSRFGISDAFETSSALKHPEVLEVPSEAREVSSQLVRLNAANRNGHFLLESDVTALVACAQNRNGDFIVIGAIPEKIAAVKFAVTMALTINDFLVWKTFLKATFPSAAEHIESFVNQENFNQLLANIFDLKITFARHDLSEPFAHLDIQNFLEIETGNRSIALISAANQEDDISRMVLAEQMGEYSPEADDFAIEKEQILQKRQSAFENYQQNIEAFSEEDGETLIIYTDKDKKVRESNWVQIRDGWDIHSDSFRTELVAREAAHAQIFSEAYYMAAEFRTAAKELPGITADQIPLLDTLTKETDGNWSLCLVNPKEPNNFTTVKTKAPIFEKVSNFLKRISYEHINTSGSTALNLIFGVQALCHWVEYGFRADVQGISDKSLATAMEVHFYVNAVGIVEGLTVSGYFLGAAATNLAIRNALLIKAIAPFVKVSLSLAKISTAGRTLISLGRFASKTLNVIGFVVNFVDLGLNIFELTRNNDPGQRPILITNTVFSAVGLSISIAAVVADLVGATAWNGPLALVGLAVAVISIPVTILVVKFTGAIERAKSIGKLIQWLVEEIQNGTYHVNETGKFLASPSYIAVKELTLSSKGLKLAYGKVDYKPTSTSTNWFTYWYYAKDYVDANHVMIPVDDSIRTIVMPHIPGYTFEIEDEWVPFAGNRHDAEFDMARDLQSKDSGFKFQRSEIGLNDEIASSFKFNYENTDIHINIQESSWQMVFPWGDPDHGTSYEEANLIKASNSELKSNLEKISYYIRAEKAGRQHISLPGLECPLNMHLDATVKDVSWFLQITEYSSQVKITENEIKLGEKQNIKLSGQESAIYAVITKYNDAANGYSGIAYVDLRKNVHFYNKDATKDEQDKAVFLFDTTEYACFYLHKDDDTLWFVCNETKKLQFKVSGVKTFQNQGDGTVVVSKAGVIYYVAKDLRTQLLSGEIYAFTEDWFNQKGDALTALSAMNIMLQQESHNSLVHLYVPHRTLDGKVIQTHFWYCPDVKKCFVSDENYTQVRFVSCDHESLHLYAETKKELIVTAAMDITEMAKKIAIYEDKFHVHMDEQTRCTVLLRGVLDAYPAVKGLSVRIECGLEFLFYKESDEKSSHYRITVIRFHLDNFAEHADTGERLLNDASFCESELRTKHFGDSIGEGAQIKRTEFVALMHEDKNVGFSIAETEGYSCSAHFPNANNIRTIGHDANHVYHIVDYESAYQCDWVKHLREVKNGPQNDATLLIKAEVLELFDKTLFFKLDDMRYEYVDENFKSRTDSDRLNATWSAVRTLSKSSGLDFILLESTKYFFSLADYENISFSSVDFLLHQKDVKIEVHCHQDMYVERQDFDLCLSLPTKNAALVLKNIFATDYYLTIIFRNGRTWLGHECWAFIRAYAQLTENRAPIFLNDKPFYPKVSHDEIFERLGV